MSKELEALENNDLLKDLHNILEQSMKYDNKSLISNDKWDSYKRVKQALTPPTEEQMCDMLSEYYRTKVYYEHTKFKHGFNNGVVYMIMFKNNEIELTTKYFNSRLPANIMLKLGQFCEVLEDDN